jgi:uncharacterized damage-inducible protein DinB
MEHLQYPLGRFNFDKDVATSDIGRLIHEIRILPEKLAATIAPLTPEEFNTPYRPGGWKVKQVVHHLVDSHMNALIRFQLALTEDTPTIRPYHEHLWAELPFQQTLSTASSQALLSAIHGRFVALLESMNNSDFERTYIHPEYKRVYSLKKATALYAWHGQHHLAQITGLIERNFDRL